MPFLFEFEDNTLIDGGRAVIGFINVSDIPRLITSFIVGVILLGLYFWLLHSLPTALLKSMSVVWEIGFVLVLWASISGGGYIWERIRARF